MFYACMGLHACWYGGNCSATHLGMLLQDLVLKEAYRVLRDGGEMYFSDVYCFPTITGFVEGEHGMR